MNLKKVIEKKILIEGKESFTFVAIIKRILEKGVLALVISAVTYFLFSYPLES